MIKMQFGQFLAHSMGFCTKTNSTTPRIMLSLPIMESPSLKFWLALWWGQDRKWTLIQLLGLKMLDATEFRKQISCLSEWVRRKWWTSILNFMNFIVLSLYWPLLMQLIFVGNWWKLFKNQYFMLFDFIKSTDSFLSPLTSYSSFLFYLSPSE